MKKQTMKSYMAERISQHFDQQIAALDNGLVDRMQAEAEKRARKRLGIDDFEAESQQLQNEQVKLNARKNELHEHLARKLAVSSWVTTSPSKLKETVEEAAKPETELLLAHDPAGKKLLKLKAQKKGILDRLFMSCSPKEAKAIFEGLLPPITNAEPKASVA